MFSTLECVCVSRVYFSRRVAALPTLVTRPAGRGRHRDAGPPFPCARPRLRLLVGQRRDLWNEGRRGGRRSGSRRLPIEGRSQGEGGKGEGRGREGEKNEDEGGGWGGKRKTFFY